MVCHEYDVQQDAIAVTLYFKSVEELNGVTITPNLLLAFDEHADSEKYVEYFDTNYIEYIGALSHDNRLQF